MDEFPGPGQQPTGDLRGWLARARKQAVPGSREPAAPASVPGNREPAAPASVPGTPVRVRIVRLARIPAPVARGLGQAERDLFRALARAGRGARKVPDVRDVDFTLSAGDVCVVDSRALPYIVVGKSADAINVLLVPDPPDPFSLSPVKEIAPVLKQEPDSPVRKPGSDFRP
jgi:hypothetical protein